MAARRLRRTKEQLLKSSANREQWKRLAEYKDKRRSENKYVKEKPPPPEPLPELTTKQKAELLKAEERMSNAKPTHETKVQHIEFWEWNCKFCLHFNQTDHKVTDDQHLVCSNCDTKHSVLSIEHATAPT